jgi:hypothetical protein
VYRNDIMETRDKFRFAPLVNLNAKRMNSGYGFMRGTAKELGDIISPAWDGSPFDAELGIAYHGEDGPVYYTGNGTETTDGL